MYLLGYDIGSSSVKAALVDATTKKAISVVQYPESEMSILSIQPGWAEQDPEWWWQAVCKSTRKLLSDNNVDTDSIKSIGISYQMHGLVIVDKDLKVIRPSIIWCDSRASKIGDQAFRELGSDHCLTRYLNSPGNFTASKLKWVKENEPKSYDKACKMMLPGDYIAMRMTGEITTSASGLSEGILWDFKEHRVAEELVDHLNLDRSLIPEIKDVFEERGVLTTSASASMGLKKGIPVSYVAGDQPNNAFSLGVLEDNEVAATGGTSGVIYGVTDQPLYDLKSRVNGFAHVNYRSEDPKIGILLCINGSGILYSWMKKHVVPKGMDYNEMEKMMENIPVGSDGLSILPFGNGAERVLNNRNPGATIQNLQFNRHSRAHLLRASLEGIAFSFAYGFKIMKQMGIDPSIIRVGNDNLFQSKVFSTTVSNLIGVPIEVRKTTGAIGAAKGGGYGAGVYRDLKETLTDDEVVDNFVPEEQIESYTTSYSDWESRLEHLMKNV
ncbi:MAG: carbohydrate kinase [Saprospiraceae bacterium]|nr:carbohydrate kinase [Saprospiraceae bacterium]